MNPAMKGFLFLDMFGYDPTFKFAAYRSQLGSLMTIIALWWFVLYLIVTLGYFLLGSPVPSNEYNSVSAVRFSLLRQLFPHRLLKSTGMLRFSINLTSRTRTIAPALLFPVFWVYTSARYRDQSRCQRRIR
jgi:hypothetical protein